MRYAIAIGRFASRVLVAMGLALAACSPVIPEVSGRAPPDGEARGRQDDARPAAPPPDARGGSDQDGPRPVDSSARETPATLDVGADGTALRDTAAEASAADAAPPPSMDCGSPALFFCEGFEGGALRSQEWSGASSAIRIEQGRAARGGYALHVTAPAQPGGATIKHTRTLTVARDVVFVRMFVYAAGPLPLRNFSFLKVGGTLAGQRYFWSSGGIRQPWDDPAGIVRPFMNSHWVENPDPAMHPGRKSMTVPFPSDRWVCVEVEMRPQARSLAYWLDGQPVPEIKLDNPMGTFWFPPVQYLDIGLQHPHPETQGFDLWIDDVALATSRIGC